MERIKRHLRSAAGYQAVCAKWLVLAALVGVGDFVKAGYGVHGNGNYFRKRSHI